MSRAGAKQPLAYDNQTRGYLGPCPGSQHTYQFALYAVDTNPLPGLGMTSTRAQVRTAILAQLRFRERTDRAFLYECLEPSLLPKGGGAPEPLQKAFFIRKAVGWALRQYAWTEPDEVAAYVTRMHDRLSPLSRREALKNAKETE